MGEFGRINLHIFVINSGKVGLEADQCIDIILGDFQVLNYFYVYYEFGRSKLRLALRNKKAM